LLQKRNIPYQEITLTKENDEQWQEVTKRSGSRTTPQIFFGEKFIGGFTELNQQDQVDQLSSLKDTQEPKNHHCCSC
jgi:glutaredoxin